MNHFNSTLAHSRFAEAPKTPAALEVGLLRGGKMKKAQREVAGAVTDPHEQISPTPKYDIGDINRTHQQCLNARPHAPDRDDSCAVLVTKRKVEKNVLNSSPPQALLELFANFGTDALEGRNREGCDIHLSDRTGVAGERRQIGCFNGN